MSTQQPNQGQNAVKNHAREGWEGGWPTALLVAAGTLVWCLLIYFLIGDRPRDWQYGTVPYVPGESLSAIEPVPANAPNQVVLPERPTGGPNAER